MNMTHVNYSVRCVYTWMGKYLWSLITTVFQKWAYFSSLGALQAVTYIVSLLAVVEKWRKIDTLLLHTTNRRYRMAYLLVPFPMTLDDLEGHSRNARLIKCNSKTIFSTVLTDTSRRAVPRRQLSFLSCLARAYMLQTYDLTDVV